MSYVIEGTLATEMCLIVLDTLVQVAATSEVHLGTVLRVLLHALARNQSTFALVKLNVKASLIFYTNQKKKTLLFYSFSKMQSM